MGCHTGFEGSFTITPALSKEHREYLTKFSESRRVKRYPNVIGVMSPYPIHEKVGLGDGLEGGYFVDDDHDESIVDYNTPPSGQPSLWCGWIPNEDGTLLEWDGGEKTYKYDEWLVYLIAHFFNRWGYTLNGIVHWSGKDEEDFGSLVVSESVVSVKAGQFIDFVGEDVVIEEDEEVEDVSPYRKLSVVEQIETLNRLMKEQESLADQRNQLDEQIDDIQEDINELLSNLETVYDRLVVFFGKSE